MRRNFIIAGQSNPDGRGSLSEVPVYANANKIFVYAKDGTWKPGVEPIGSAVGAIDKVSADKSSAAGFGMAFANRICELYPNDTVGLIPCAMGSTFIRSWRKLNVRANLYGSMLARTIEAEGLGVTSGMLWWQGEAETTSLPDANAYAQRFTDMMSALRTDLGKPELPIAFARLNNIKHTSRHPYWAKMRAIQESIILRKSVIVSTDGLATQTDLVHYPTASYVTIGIRFADAIAPLL